MQQQQQQQGNRSDASQLPYTANQSSNTTGGTSSMKMEPKQTVPAMQQQQQRMQQQRPGNQSQMRPQQQMPNQQMKVQQQQQQQNMVRQQVPGQQQQLMQQNQHNRNMPMTNTARPNSNTIGTNPISRPVGTGQVMGSNQMSGRPMNTGGNMQMNSGQRPMMTNVKPGMGANTVGVQNIKREGMIGSMNQHGNMMTSGGNFTPGSNMGGMGSNPAMGTGSGSAMPNSVGSRPIGMMNSSGAVTGTATGPTEQEFSPALGAMPERLNELWKQQQSEMDQLAVSDKNDYKHHNDLPLARIKRIMKSDEDVRMISAEAPILFAKACEIFILDLTVRAWCFSEHNKRNGLEKDDIYAVLQHTDIFDFLAEVVINNPDPRAEDKRQ